MHVTMRLTREFIDGYAIHIRTQLSGSDRTIDERRKTLLRVDRQLPEGLLLACTEELEAWIWRDGLAMGSRETYYSALNSFFGWAYQSGRIDYNPMEDIVRPKVPQRMPNPVSDDQVTYALANAAHPYLLWIKLAAYAGCRCSDIAGLKREHITQDNVMLWCGKGRKQGAVPTHPVIWAAVKDLPPGPLTDRDARQISIHSVAYFRRTLKMPDVHLHRFRHWFGTMVQRLHKDLRVTQELLRHSNPASTAGYAKVASTDKTAAVALLPTLGASAGGGAAGAADPAAPR